MVGFHDHGIGSQWIIIEWRREDIKWDNYKIGKWVNYNDKGGEGLFMVSVCWVPNGLSVAGW